jgi:hypothetical protein
MQSDTEYLRARIEQERDAAAAAVDKRVRAKHLELAAAYVFRVREIDAQESRSAMHLLRTGSFAGLVDALREETAVIRVA